VARNLDKAPTLVNLGFARLAFQPVATEGLGQRDRFMKYPAPGLLSAAVARSLPVTERDVQFAKAMTLHHQGALAMVRAYREDRNGRNTFLGLLNVDIVAEQGQEIALMRRAIAAYPGDVDAVQVPASMVHGMEGMSHGGHGGHAGHGTAPASQAPQGHGGHAHHGH
jgi:uncharacterized protein (DUF305 family)